MNPKTSVRKSLSSLSHPITIFAMLVILINALFLQRYFPSWVSGKLSGLGWMICLPIFISLLIAILLPDRGKEHIIEFSTVMTGFLFVTIKAIPSVNMFARQIFQSLFQTPLKLALDPTDLIVVPALFIPIWIWQRAKITNFSPWCYAAIGIVCLAFMADAPAPQEKVFSCLAVDGNSTILFSNESRTYTSNEGRQVFISDDGGKTWTNYGKYNVNKSNADDPVGGIQLKSHVYACPDSSSSFDINDPAHEEISFLFVEDKGVYISTDGASSFNLDYAAEIGTEFYDAVFAPTTGDLIVAAGFDGLLFRSQAGEYAWVSVSQVFVED